MKPKVTVGVCARNCEVLVSDALESVARQDFPHALMEIIVVDDGSCDKTLSVIQGYVSRMDIQARVFHTDWQGLGAARNKIVECAKGDYIIWVDADMILPVDHVSKQIQFMENNPQIGIAKARYGISTEENLLGFLENIAFVAVDSIYGGRPTSRVLGTGGSIYRVTAIRQAGGFDVNIRGVGEDLDAEDRVKRDGWMLYLGSPALFYERRRKSLKALWRENYWHGYGGSHILRKNKKTVKIHFMTPLAAFLLGTWYSTAAYRATHRKLVFMLPLEYSFKRIAWCFGFLKAQLEHA